MADLRSNFESTLVTLRNQPFEVRWSHYWSLVLEALERAPETLEQLNRLVLDQEEQLAAADGRATIAEVLGTERAQLRREADAEVLHLMRPFFESDGTPEQRAELAAERKRIRSEIQPHAERADPADAYETYVLVLDYTTAFATAAAAAFRRSPTRREPQARVHPDAPPPRQQEPRRNPAPQPSPEQARPAGPKAPAYDVHPRQSAEGRSREPGERRPREPADRRSYELAEARAHQSVEMRAPEPAPRRYEVPTQETYRSGPVEPVDYRDPPEIALSMPDDAPRGGWLGKAVAAVVVLCLIASGVGAYIFKPEWFGLSGQTQSTATDDSSEQPVAEQPVAEQPQQTANETPPEPESTTNEIPSTPLDRYYAAIIGTQAAECTPPDEIAKSSWTEIAALVECTRTHGVELVSTFRFMLTRAGGKWSENGTWSAPEGPMREQLLSAWKHVTQTRNRWNAEASAAVKEYASSYFGFQSHGTTGWRFAAWRCRCNINGEFDVNDTANVKPRLFITRPARIETEDDARVAYAQVRNFFLGPDAPGKAQTVEQGINNVHLPYDLPGGLGMARPLETKEAAEEAWREVTALHAGIGFAVSELKWTTN